MRAAHQGPPLYSPLPETARYDDDFSGIRHSWWLLLVKMRRERERMTISGPTEGWASGPRRNRTGPIAVIC